MRVFTIDQREELIEAIGVKAADEIESLKMEIDSIYRYLGVGKVYSTSGFKLIKLHDQ